MINICGNTAQTTEALPLLRLALNISTRPSFRHNRKYLLDLVNRARQGSLVVVIQIIDVSVSTYLSRRTKNSYIWLHTHVLDGYKKYRRNTFSWFFNCNEPEDLILKLWLLTIKMQWTRKGKEGQMARNLADMRNVRHCHSSLSLGINGRTMTGPGLIPQQCKARRERTFREEYLCYSFMLILCGKQLHLYSEWIA